MRPSLLPATVDPLYDSLNASYQGWLEFTLIPAPASAALLLAAAPLLARRRR